MTKASAKSNDGSDFDDDALQEAYQQTYSQWLRVRKKNQCLVSRVDAFVISKETLECKVQVVETLAAEKESKLKEILLELEKSLKIFNLGTSKLDHVLILGKSSKNQRRLSVVGEMSRSKSMFVKGFDLVNIATSLPPATKLPMLQ